MSETSKRASVFSCGTQAADWQCTNCERCKKNAPNRAAPTCEIQLAMGEAMFSDGSFSEEMAARMGGVGHNKFLWQCPEVEWTDEWKAEYRRRQTWRYRIRRLWCEKRRSIAEWTNKKREARRMRKAEKIYDMPGNRRCWADLVQWALFRDKDFPDPNGEDRCAAEKGGCYCGKFETTEAAKP